MPYRTEHSCRLVEPDKVDIVGSGDREHDGKKYRVIFAKPKGGDGSIEQAYRYPIDGWSESEARAHCRAHDGILFEPATGREAGAEYSFQAGLLRLEADKKRAVFYLMNTSRNRNRWGVTDKALEEGLPSIMGKPICCGADYKLGHMKKTIIVGKFVDYVKPDGYALGIAEITDDQVLAKIESAEWGPISVLVEAFASRCSVCGQDITTEGYEHEHIKNGSGYIVVDSFVFQRVDFVEDPAYPQAGLQEILAEAERAAEQPITLLAGYYMGNGGEVSQSKQDGPLGARGDPNPKEKEKKRMEAQLEQLKQEQETLKTENKTLKAELKTTTEKLTKYEVELKAATDKATDVTKLQVEIDVLKAERHQVEVDATAEARYQAGLTTDLKMEKERLKLFAVDTLRMLREDAAKVKGKLEAQRPTAPKTKYGKEDGDEFTAAVAKRKQELGIPVEVK